MKKLLVSLLWTVCWIYSTDVNKMSEKNNLPAQVQPAVQAQQEKAPDQVQDVRPVVDPYYASQLEMYEDEEEPVEQTHADDEPEAREQLGPEELSEHFSEVGTETIEL